MDTPQAQWFAMRDLRRPNARVTAFAELTAAGFETFTPLKWVLTRRQGKTERRQVPVIPDLLFVRSTRADLDPVVSRHPTLQYRYIRGAQATPMTVPAPDMERFIQAVTTAADTRYYLPDEITPAMIGSRVRIVGGPMDNHIGNLLYIRGSRIKRLIVQIPGLITAAVQVSPTALQLLP